MNIPELKKSVEYLYKRAKNYYKDEKLTDEEEKEKKSLYLVLSACQLLCDVSNEMLPKMKKCHKTWEYDCHDCTKAEGYNLAREEDILWLTKRMMRIRKVFDQFIEVGENKLGMMYTKELADKISDAIRQEILKGGEE